LGREIKTTERVGHPPSSRMVHAEDAWTYKLETTAEAQVALHFGHNLILQNVGIQNEHFKLGLDHAIGERVQAFASVWANEESGTE
jgi:hypothetical protein